MTRGFVKLVRLNREKTLKDIHFNASVSKLGAAKEVSEWLQNFSSLLLKVWYPILLLDL